MVAEDPDFSDARRRMVEELARRGVRDARVLDAMRRVPREAFVDERLHAHAYDDGPLPIGHRQTISQPEVVALMVEAAGIGPHDRVLDVGTGSGYAAAVLSLVAGETFSIERHASLAETAAARLAALDFSNVSVRTGDGAEGWPEHAPFDAIVAAAGADAPPPALLAQLKTGGRLVMPVGRPPVGQRLVRIVRRGAADFGARDLCGVRFVPLLRGLA